MHEVGLNKSIWLQICRQLGDGNERGSIILHCKTGQIREVEPELGPLILVDGKKHPAGRRKQYLDGRVLGENDSLVAVKIEQNLLPRKYFTGSVRIDYDLHTHLVEVTEVTIEHRS